MSMQEPGQGSQTINRGQTHEELNQAEVRRMPRRNNWSPDSDELLVKILLEESAGNRMISGSFSPSVWGRVCNAYVSKTKEDITVLQLKSRWKTLKKLYRLYSSLVNKSGWSWDDDNHRPTPGCPTVWEEIIQFNKEYKVARDKPFPLYKMIHELARKSTATGQYASHTGCGEYTNIPIVEVAESTDSSGKHVEEEVDKNKDRVQHASEKGPCKSSGNSKRKKACISSTTGSKRRSQEQTIEMVEKLVDLSTERSIIAKELKSKDDSCAYGDCIDVLKSIPDITDEELFIGGKALRSRRDRVWFMKMRPSAQAYWLREQVMEWHDMKQV